MDPKNASDFKRAAAENRDVSFPSELWGFMKTNKKLWLLPILVALSVFALFIFLSGTGVAPFIYTLF